MTDNERRSTERRIDDLLNQTMDPVQRAIVIVLANINRELIENTRATRELAVGVEANNNLAQSLDGRVTQHMVDEEIMLAGFKGRAALAVWVAPFLFTSLGGIGAYIWTGQKEMIRELAVDLRSTSAHLAIVTQRQQVNEEKISSLERRQVMDDQTRQNGLSRSLEPDPPNRWRNSGSTR